jgi:multidrug transporter EmrE-like cation transporter
MPSQLTLLVAILAEVIATTALKASEGFTRPWPSLLVVLGYAIAFYCLSLTMRSLPLGLVYALWSGLGLLLITLAGWLIWGQRLDGPSLVGMALIVAGVCVINLSGRAH